MLRPGGKASRIYKKVSSQEGEMPKKNNKKSPKSREKSIKGIEETIHRRSYAIPSSKKGSKKMSLLQSREYSLNPKARNP